ncbi:hypothetical protein Q4575_02960 [Psychrosphaera sp. 1_MG-2023]|uniref:hypothetical protein n=1 Tax=Psychrosphaera sp. 1_MG-2023 TaxID=3062643 RepID=UPI0026E30C88|nr:hypothetical protein [Psychrosphaera sp. 1_MG-2023]MDO6718341.1 hypothetical protein [Psychrosphaera sp. 1_MG-2023]
MSSSEIARICAKLVADGKEPTVALIKGKLSTKTALPLIIDGLKRWKNNPNASLEPETTEQKQQQPISLDQRVSDLEALVGQLTNEISELKKRL